MDNADLTTVFTTNNIAEAEILKSMLESEGIRCQLDGQHQASFSGLMDIRGLTRAADEDRARKLLGHHGQRGTESPSHPPEHAGHSHPRVGIAQTPHSRQYFREKSDRS